MAMKKYSNSIAESLLGRADITNTPNNESKDIPEPEKVSEPEKVTEEKIKEDTEPKIKPQKNKEKPKKEVSPKKDITESKVEEVEEETLESEPKKQSDVKGKGFSIQKKTFTKKLSKSFYISEEVYNKLQEMSEETGLSMSEVMDEILRQIIL